MAPEQPKFNQRRTPTKTACKYINSRVRFTQLTDNVRIIFYFISNYVSKITNLVNIFQRMTIQCNTGKKYEQQPSSDL